jgi:hypothetical protein
LLGRWKENGLQLLDLKKVAWNGLWLERFCVSWLQELVLRRLALKQLPWFLKEEQGEQFGVNV